MKKFPKLLALAVGISLFFTFSFASLSLSDEEKEIHSLKKKITELEKRIKDLENLLEIYNGQKDPESGKKQGWVNKKNWRNLKKGMTKKEVERILGKPVKSIDGFRTIWYYPSFYKGSVSFDEKGSLTGWIEP